MPYLPKYCTKAGIALKLRGRLNLQVDEFTPAIYSQSVPSISLDDNLVDNIIEQTEDFLDLILSQIYEMPLQNSHPILRNIVESFVISELLRVSFQGSGIASLGGDLSGSGADTKQYAYSLLNMLTAGLNIPIPGQIPTQMIPGVAPPQPLRLPGEIRRYNYQDNDLITNNYVYVQTSNIKVNKNEDLEF